MGDDFTSSEGYAEVNYDIPATSSLGAHIINVTYEANLTIYSYSTHNDSVSVDIYSTSNISIMTDWDGQTVDKGDIIGLEAIIKDSINGSKIANYPCNFSDNVTGLLYTNLTNSTGHCLYRWNTSTAAYGPRIVQANITDNTTLYYFADSPDDVDSITLTINDPPTVTAPVYNVTSEILRGNGTEISCSVWDSEDLGELTVTIDVLAPNNTWSNETSTTNITSPTENTFSRNYSTDSDYDLGFYTAVCSATDSTGARVENSSTFLVYGDGRVTIELNATTVYYGDIVNASGRAFYADTLGDVTADSNVEIKIGGTTKCTDTTDAIGGYACYFSAPQSVGTHTVIVEVTDLITEKLITNSTSLTVSVIYGEEEAEREEAENVGCYEVPKIIQNPDGSIEKVTVKICVWK